MSLTDDDVERIADRVRQKDGVGKKIQKIATLGGQLKVNKKLIHLYTGKKIDKSYIEPNYEKIRKLHKKILRED